MTDLRINDYTTLQLGHSATHKLTVTADGSVRIKIAKDTDAVVAKDLTARFMVVSEHIRKQKEPVTLRGKVRPNIDKFCKIVMYSNGKSNRIHFSYEY